MSQRILFAMFAAEDPGGFTPAARSADDDAHKGVKVAYRTMKVVDGLDIFYREAGPKNAPCVLLLHGFPSSSHQFRNLIPLLADKYRVVAPDFPGYGESSSPPADKFPYTCDSFTNVTEAFTEKLGLKSYAIYLHDIGSSVGFRLAARHPERVTGLIIQNADAYPEALNKEFIKPLVAYWEDRSEAKAKPLRDWLLTIEGTKWHYLHGARHPELISPDNWVIDQAGQDRPGNKDRLLVFLYDTKTNLDHYKAWQEYFRKHQPPALVLWGKNDGIFTVEGAEMYRRDLKDIEYHYFETGHFTLEEDVVPMAALMRDFLARVTAKK